MEAKGTIRGSIGKVGFEIGVAGPILGILGISSFTISM